MLTRPPVVNRKPTHTAWASALITAVPALLLSLHVPPLGAQGLESSLKALTERLSEQTSSAEEADNTGEVDPGRLASAEASQIAVARQTLVDTGDNIRRPQMLRDGVRAIYAKTAGQRHSFVILDLSSQESTAILPAAGLTSNFILSPDEKRLAYCHSRFGTVLGILDLSTQQTINLPSKASINTCSRARLAWQDNSQIIVVPKEGAKESYALDLDTLQKKPLFRHESETRIFPSYAPDEEISLFRESLFSALRLSRHPNAYIRSGGPGILLVANRERTFSRHLLDEAHEWTVSPDLEHLLFVDYASGGNPSYRVYIATLGARPPATLRYTVQLGGIGGLDDSRRSILTRMLAEGVPVYGKVFKPQVNPLNGQVVGVDRRRFKGTVQVFAIRDTSADVQVVQEETKVQTTDVIGHLYANTRDSLGTALNFQDTDFFLELRDYSGND